MLTIEEELGNSGTIIGNDHSLDGPENQIVNSLNLSVIHSENKRPIGNALISIECIGKTAVCNTDGELCLTDLKPGKYDIDVICPGFIAQRISILIPVEEPNPIRVKMISNS
jgi:hypothetical protein